MTHEEKVDYLEDAIAEMKELYNTRRLTLEANQKQVRKEGVQVNWIYEELSTLEEDLKMLKKEGK